MKVLFVSNDPSLFDAASPARARMRTYAELMGELHILSSASGNASEEQEGKLFLHPVHTAKLFRVRVLGSRARTLIQKYAIDVVSAQDPFEHGLAAARAVRGTQAKLHIQIHTDFLSPWFVRAGSWQINLLNSYRCKIANHVLPQADGIRVVSERIKKSLIARYGRQIPEPVVIPIGVDGSTPVPVALPAHSFAFALIAVGRLEPEKRIEDILKALTQHPAVGLFIVGSGRERRKLVRMAKTLGLTKNVVFLGNRSDVRGIMASADGFIQASAYEGYGRTLIEAALAKVPIITTDVGIVGEVFDKQNAFIVPVADVTKLSNAIQTCLESAELRETFIAHAEEAVRKHLASFGDIPKRIVEDLIKT